MRNAIPSEPDWRSEPWNLDVPQAYEHFFGKSRKEAVELFVDNALLYQEDIMFMPAACFRYYVQAYVDYLMSARSAGDSDAASCFLSIVEVRRDDLRGVNDQLAQRVRDVLARLAASQSWYEAAQAIYGDFGARTTALLPLIT